MCGKLLPIREVIIIRRIELTMDEQRKYEVIKNLVDSDGNKDRAALSLDLARRQVNRLIKAYKEAGKAAFHHGNAGRKPATTVPSETRQLIVDLYRAKYYEAIFTHYAELLECYEQIRLSVPTIASILEAEGILSPRVTRAKKKRIKKELEEKKKTAKTQKEADRIQANLVAVEDAHSRRPRASSFGELLQMDASPLEWVPGQIWHLHVSIDDSTGTVTGAWFDTQETLNAYYHVLHQTLMNHGIPYKIFTDRRTVFTYKKKNSPSIEEDTYTQFAYACKQLGIQLESSSIPQAKGRVERLNQTLQSRLPVELRLRGITTIDAANEFLNSYIKEFNEKFSLPLNGIRSVFEKQPSEEKINLILAVLSGRTVDSGHCIQYQNAYYRLLDSHGVQTHYLKGTKVMVIQALDGSLFCSVNDKDIYTLDQIPLREKVSPDFDEPHEESKPKKRYIPPMTHPWKRASFEKFVKKQQHHLQDTVVA